MDMEPPPPPPPPPPAMMYLHHSQQPAMQPVQMQMQQMQQAQMQQMQQMHQAHQVAHVPQMPPISEMLMREADAWRALLGLHALGVDATRQVKEASSTEGEAMLDLNQKEEDSDQRECMYHQSITHLLSQYDALTTELVKIRSLRKAKRTAQSAAEREVLRVHTDETLALGSMIATRAGQSVTALTAELRLVNQQLRTQLEQTRALLQALHDVERSEVPSNAVIVIGLRREGGDTVYPVSDVLQHVYASAAEKTVTEEGILRALQRLEKPSPAKEVSVSSGRTVPRRSAPG